MPANVSNVPVPERPATSYGGTQEMPHGLIEPPEIVRQFIAKEKARFLPLVFGGEQEERSLNDLTLQYYFESLVPEVLYRSTLDGPEVLAVGYEEIFAFTKDMSLEARGKLKTWMA